MKNRGKLNNKKIVEGLRFQNGLVQKLSHSSIFTSCQIFGYFACLTTLTQTIVIFCYSVFPFFFHEFSDIHLVLQKKLHPCLNKSWIKSGWKRYTLIKVTTNIHYKSIVERIMMTDSSSITVLDPHKPTQGIHRQTQRDCYWSNKSC